MKEETPINKELEAEIDKISANISEKDICGDECVVVR
jgi:hypothetical protein